MKLHKVAHTVYKTQYRIVWAARFHRRILGEDVVKYSRVKLLQKHYTDWHVPEMGIDKDHVHMVISPKYRSVLR